VNSAGRCHSIKTAMQLTARVIEPTERYSRIVSAFGAIGAGKLLGPIVFEARISETLAALAAGAPLDTKLRADLERAAARPKTFVMWARRHQPMIRKILKTQAKTPTLRARASSGSINSLEAIDHEQHITPG
jgi:glycosyltransferase A (GT-A) superfamily protein (DUF2064 family)